MRPAFLALALLACAGRPAAAQPATRAGADIRALERALADAMHARDAARLEELLASDYVLRGTPDIDRATWLANALNLCWGERSDIDGFELREHDDVAVATLELTFYVDPMSCTPAVLRSLLTDVWVREEGVWRLRVRHAGPSPGAGAGVAAQYGLVPELPPWLEVNGELSLVAAAGNSSTRTLGLAADATHRTDATTTWLALAFLTSEADSVTRARSLRAQGRHGFRAAERVELFGRSEYARDRFAGIANRFVGEGGAAYSPALPRGHTLKAEAGAGYTVEERLEATDLRFVTARGALGYGWESARGAEVRNDLAVTADLESSRNWRATNAAALTVRLNRILSLKASHRLEYRNFPVPGFERLDMTTSAAVVLSLARRPAAGGRP